MSILDSVLAWFPDNSTGQIEAVNSRNAFTEVVNLLETAIQRDGSVKADPAYTPQEPRDYATVDFVTQSRAIGEVATAAATGVDAITNWYLLTMNYSGDAARRYVLDYELHFDSNDEINGDVWLKIEILDNLNALKDTIVIREPVFDMKLGATDTDFKFSKRFVNQYPGSTVKVSVLLGGTWNNIVNTSVAAYISDVGAKK